MVNMEACSGIKESGLELDKELNTVLEKNYRIKENIRENIKEKNLEVQSQQDKHDLSRQDDNTNNDNPSNNSDIFVLLSDIKSDINSVKTSIEDGFARKCKFFKSVLQKKELVEQNLRGDIRNITCEISFVKKY